MPKDGFYEESAISNRSRTEEKIYTACKVIAIILFALSASAGVLLSPQYIHSVVTAENSTTVDHVIGIAMWFGLIVAVFGSGLIFWFLKNKFNVSYDYTFVEDELRVTKVFNGKRRKFLITLKADRILQIGWVDSEAFENTLRGLGNKKPKVYTPNREPANGKELIYVLHSSSIEKAVYILEMRRQLLENLVYAAGRSKLVQK